MKSHTRLECTCREILRLFAQVFVSSVNWLLLRYVSVYIIKSENCAFKISDVILGKMRGLKGDLKLFVYVHFVCGFLWSILILELL